ncbi:MAG: sigma-70 family RNA polymerase sigma factor [Myxococcales bacterium]
MTDRRAPSIKGTGGATSPVAEDGHLSAADLFKQYARFVASFLIRMGISRSDLDDVMQEVFLVAHKMGGYTPGPAKPTTFLANIAFRAATTHRRKGKVRSFVYANDELVGAAPGDDANPERSADNVQRLELLQRCLDELDDDKRAIFVMAEIQGETVVSIAEGLGIPVDTAYSRLRAARKLFKQAAQKLSDEEPSALAPSVQRAGS